MDNAAFDSLVAEMRTLQKRYFKYRDSDVLRESKELEKKVDAAIVELTDPDRPPQKDLFTC